MPKTEGAQGATQNSKSLKRTPKTAVAKEIETQIQSVSNSAQNKAIVDLKNSKPEYQLIGIMGLRRTKLIQGAKPQTLVLEDDIYSELVIRGIRNKVTWDELTRAIIANHLKEHRDSDFLFA